MTPPRLTINIPNILTLIRILLIPLFIIALLNGIRSFALFIFIIAAVSDALDGLAARWLNQRTILGAYLDPIADKLLIVSSFICLAILGVIPDWLAVIVLSRDVLILVGIAILKMMETSVEISPSPISKSTTAVQLFTAGVILLDPDFPLNIWLYYITAGLTVVSGFHYVYLGMNLLQDEPDGPTE